MTLPHTERYHGGRREGCFEGWYFRHGGEFPFSVIVGESTCSADRHCFLQYIDLTRSAYFRYPPGALFYEADGMRIRLGNNLLSASGLNVETTGELPIRANIRYGPLAPLVKSLYAPSAMGPLTYLPMPCRHGVISMGHTAEGTLSVCGETHGVRAKGYIEKDYGKRFPPNYFWMHAACGDISIMTAVARPVVANLRGHICVVQRGDRQYNLSLYNLGRVDTLQISDNSVTCRIRRGKNEAEFTVRASQTAQPLLAPDAGGNMRVRILENLGASVEGRLRLDGGELPLSGACAYEVVTLPGQSV